MTANAQAQSRKQHLKVFVWCYFLLMYFVTTIGDVGLHSIIAGLVSFLAIQGFWFLFCKRPLKKLQHRLQETILLASFAFALLVQAIGHLLKLPDLAFALLTGFALGAITFLVITSPVASSS